MGKAKSGPAPFNPQFLLARLCFMCFLG